MESKELYWVGKYESDIEGAYFFGSITYYGTNANNNVSFCSNKARIDSQLINEFIQFIYQNMCRIICSNHQSYFMFYNPNWAYEIINIDKALQKNIICLNHQSIVTLLNNKIQTKIWMSKYCDIPPFKLACKDECSYESLSKLFPNYNEFIIQNHISSGGKGTFLLNSNNENDVLKQLDNSLYIVSPKINNALSLNVHICIGINSETVFPISLQLVRQENNKLLYIGADFIEVKSIDKKIQEKIKSVSRNMAKSISTLGYKGVLGLDFLLGMDNKLYFVEINPRFQGSTVLLDKALINYEKESIYQLNEKAFAGQYINSSKYESIIVNSSFVFYKQYNADNYYTNLYNRMTSAQTYTVLSDGFEDGIYCNYNSYLFRVIFNRNISKINHNNELNIVESLFHNNCFDIPVKNQSDLIRLKIALIVQGVVLEDSAYQFICKSATIKDATFNAIDITIFNNLKVNSPVNIPFVDISPFLIKYNIINGLELYYNEKYISKVDIDTEDDVPELTVPNKIPFKSIGFRTNDRVRIRHSSYCYFKENNMSCSFCESKHNKKFRLELDDIFYVIDEYEKLNNFRHYLIGGASGVPEKEHIKIIKIASYIHEHSKKPVYLMALPPKNVSVVKKYFNAGINEIAFNLEVFDRNKAQKIMKGKGSIELTQYTNAFKESVKYLGNTGKVRSMLIMGLESDESFLEGIEYLASLGVAPMIGVLRPMPNSGFRDYIPHSIEHISQLYSKAELICRKYNISLGPSCEECQNNTISLPFSFKHFFNN